jgi:hypothetical protein
MTLPQKNRHRLTKAQIEQLDTELWRIAAEFQPITVRGVFYQAEVRELVPKTEQGYDLVQRRLVKLRRWRVVPYDWITDSSRMVRGRRRYSGVADFQRQMASLYRKDYWANQPDLVEIWIEKDALAGTIYPTVVEEWGLDLYVNRGFTSLSYLHSAAQAIIALGKTAHIYVLSDFDPSGKCAADKVGEGLWELVGDAVEVHVYDLAVTQDQIAEWQLPSRPTKSKDNTHYRKFAETYGEGTESVELDAIRPDLLRGLVSDAIERHWTDPRSLDVIKAIEAEERREFLPADGDDEGEGDDEE